ncbi:MAG: GntR family transcriptional regulator [Anaerolineaceae bacterium]|nr:GntR family transcriptional regulator [Anaerolineaceae bacterium]
MKCPSIDFRINPRSGVPAYAQIKQQVIQAMRLGYLIPGDQLPTVKEVVSHIAINPNTVFKAYRELESEGLVESRQGLGTFVMQTLASDSAADIELIRGRFETWLKEAREAGLALESIEAIIHSVLYQSARL